MWGVGNLTPSLSTRWNTLNACRWSEARGGYFFGPLSKHLSLTFLNAIFIASLSLSFLRIFSVTFYLLSSSYDHSPLSWLLFLKRESAVTTVVCVWSMGKHVMFCYGRQPIYLDSKITLSVISDVCAWSINESHKPSKISNLEKQWISNQKGWQKKKKNSEGQTIKKLFLKNRVTQETTFHFYIDYIWFLILHFSLILRVYYSFEDRSVWLSELRVSLQQVIKHFVLSWSHINARVSRDVKRRGGLLGRSFT